MLGDKAVHPVLLSTDLGQTRDFYHGQLGLEVLDESAAAIEFGCGAGTRIVVTHSTVGTADTNTKVGWDVDDLEAELADLRERGVTIQEYDMPGLKTVNGIVEFGVWRYAWIADPHGNVLGLGQRRRP